MKKINFILFLFLSAITISLTSCVKGEKDPEYTSYKTNTEETSSKDTLPNNEDSITQEVVTETTVSPEQTPTPKQEDKQVSTESKTSSPTKTNITTNETKRVTATSSNTDAKQGEEKPKIVRGETSPNNAATTKEPAQPTYIKGKKAIFTVDKSNHEFGFINEGTKITHVYTVKNIGFGDLTIKEVKPSCNCTVPNFSTASVPPGGSTTITLVFDSNDKVGTQRKTATVITNVGEFDLTMTGTVRPKNMDY